jgi:hypothetical protein
MRLILRNADVQSALNVTGSLAVSGKVLSRANREPCNPERMVDIGNKAVTRDHDAGLY